MKYRMLTHDELIHLDEDLKHFLIVNGVHDTQWEALNRDSPEKAAELVGVFSDTVLQKVYEKLEYLEFRSPDACLVFRCGKESMTVIALNRRRDAAIVDLSTPEGIHNALVNHPDSLTWFRSEKAYISIRELEIHYMIEQGCFVSTADFWESLQQLFS